MLVTRKSSEAKKKAYASDLEKFKDASKKAYANDPKKYKEAVKIAYAEDPVRFKEASKKVTMLILKRKDTHQKQLTKKTCKSVNKLLKLIIVSIEKKYVVRNKKNMYCVHQMKAL